MSDPVLRARLVEAARVLSRQAADLEAAAADLSDDVRLIPIVPAPVWVMALPFFWAEDRERHEVTRRCFHHFRNVADALGMRVTGMGSEGAVSRALWAGIFDEIDYAEYPQNFVATNAGSVGLRAKFDESIRRTRYLNPDRVFIGGSDDIIPLDWFAKAFASDADLVGVTGGALIVGMQNREPTRSQLWDGRYKSGKDLEFCGGGLVMSRRLLEAWEWAPFRDPSDEVGIERRARAEGWVVEGIAGRFYAIKCKQVLNSYSIGTRLGAVAQGMDEFRQFKQLWDSLA